MNQLGPVSGKPSGLFLVEAQVLHKIQMTRTSAGAGFCEVCCLSVCRTMGIYFPMTGCSGPKIEHMLFYLPFVGYDDGATEDETIGGRPDWRIRFCDAKPALSCIVNEQ